MVIPNIVTKFQNFDICETFVKFLTCRLLTPATWKVLSPFEDEGKTRGFDDSFLPFFFPALFDCCFCRVGRTYAYVKY